MEQQEKFITIGEAAKQIGRSARTIKNWYEWQQLTGENVLPQFYRNIDSKGTRYFLKSDIPKLEAFRDSISRGKLAEVSRTKWGKRGKEVKTNERT